MIRALIIAAILATAVPLASQPPQVGETKDGGVIVPTYQRIRPAGESLAFNGRPVDLALAPNGKTLYLKDNRGIVVVNTETWKIQQELPFTGEGSSLHGILLNRAGTQIFATNAQDAVFVGDIAPNGSVTWAEPVRLPDFEKKNKSYPCGLALSQDERTLYVCLSRNNSVAAVDLATRQIRNEIKVGVAPFDAILAGERLFVSNWGGRLPRKGERTAPSGGTPTLVDERGIAKSGTISLLSLAENREMAQNDAGLHASDMVLSQDGNTFYVANANEDTVSVFDAKTGKAQAKWTVKPDLALPFGSAPNALALSTDGKTLFVALGGNNAIAVLDVRKPSSRALIKGFIPAGFYPGALVADAKTLYIANVKGFGSRTLLKDAKGYNSHGHKGSVQRVPLPDAVTLRRYTAQVKAEAMIPQILLAQERSLSETTPVPVPAKAGEPSPLEHVVYIIKENRTYDQVFGDLPQGNGDPKLCIFGREITPNQHAIAEQFVLLDNFYCNGILSADGHSWATEGNVTDHLEKAFGGFTRSYTFGDDPLTYSSTGFIWDNVLQKGLSFRNYGEMNYTEPVPANADFKTIYQDFTQKTNKIRFTHNIGIDRLRSYSHRDYPGWNMNIPDVLRAEVFLKEFAQYNQTGNFPNFTILYLPSDHTSGTSPGSPTPRAQVADNDLALGRVVEAVSKSQFWAKTCIFVVEDDPQDGFDHVDGHRSPCLVISPYTKRGKVVHNFYNQTSVLHTMQRILGVPALTQFDSRAPLMKECFTTKPDFRPFTSLANRVPLDEMNPPLSALKGKARHWAELSRRLPLERVDAADEDDLNRILWHAMKGVNAPYPKAFAGAHGKGLTPELRRKLSR